MKKILTLLMCAVIAFSFAACGGGGSSNDSGPDNSAPANSDEEIAATDGAAIAAEARVNTEAKGVAHADANATSAKDTLTFAATVDPGKITLGNLLDLSTYPLAMAAVEYFLRYDYVNGGFFSPVGTYEVDEDYKGITFHITPDIKMNDGSGDTLNADDIVASMLAFRNNSGLGWQLDFVNIDGVEKIDDLNLHIPFNDVNGVWESAFMMFEVISGKVYNELGADKFYQAPVSPAQYRLADYVPGDHLAFEGFDDYHFGAPKIKNFVMKIVSDGTASFMELQNGNVDLVWNINADQVKSAAKDDKLQLILMENTMINFLGMNCYNKALGDFRVREAIWLAVDRAEIILGAYDGLATPSPSILTKMAMGYDDQYEANEPYPTDIEKAKELMNEAGYGDGLKLRLLSESTINYQLVSEQLVAMLGEIGIELEPTLTDYATENATMYGGDLGAYDLFLFNSMTSDEAISYIDNPMLYGASHWEEAADGSGQGFQDILHSIRTTPDIEKRTGLYVDMQKYFFEKGLYWIPLNIAQNYIGCDASLIGFDYRGHLVNFNTVYYQ